MQRHRIEGIAVLDEETGKLTLEVAYSRKRKARKFLKVYQDGMKQLTLRHPELQGKTLRVLNWLIGDADNQNRTPTVSRVAGDLGMQVSHVSRAYGDLLKVGALVKLDGAYRISPELCWRGTEVQLQEMYRQLQVEDRRALPALREG